jgi:amidophosphoribosyltransferase
MFKKISISDIMCGIVGIMNHDNNNFVNQTIIHSLTFLQHRGQDSAGIYSLHNNCFHKCKNLGKVSDVFNKNNIFNLKGALGIGHVRYSTSGSVSVEQAQPFYTDNPYGIALVHNGNLTNTRELIETMKKCNRHINTTSDSEVLLCVFSQLLASKKIEDNIINDIFESVGELMRMCRGGYSVIMIINNVGLLAFRDPHGIRPLCYGERKAGTNTREKDYIFSSESVAIDSLADGFQLTRDVQPGECVLIENDCKFHSKIMSKKIALMPCIFEYIYFARPDSVIDEILVYEARIKMGEVLANKILRVMPDYREKIDVIMPIPETSRFSALAIANSLKIPYSEGYIKNHYISRTFIMPNQEIRKKNIKLKLSTIKKEFLDKNVLIIDDSIVRGTTSIELVQLAREAGAKAVYFASVAPPVSFPNVYGIDIPTREELIANGRTIEEIGEILKADKVIFNELKEVEQACIDLNPKIKGFETSCFNGKYITGNINEDYLQLLERNRTRV